MTTYITIRNIGAGFYNLPGMSEGKPVIRMGEIVHELGRDENGILVETDDERVSTYAEEADLDQIIPIDPITILETNHRDPHYWRTDHTQELVELMQHERTCKCPECSGEPDDDWVEEEAQRLAREREAEAVAEEAAYEAQERLYDHQGRLHERTPDPDCETCRLIKAGKCPHAMVTIEWKLTARETRSQPAEYIGRARCDECGETMEPEDVPSTAKIADRWIHWP